MMSKIRVKFDLLLGHRVGQIVQTTAPWLALLAMLLWGWRVTDFFQRIPAYGDALEVIWGIRHYHDALFAGNGSAFFTPLVFAPNGWHTTTLAHTPLLFLLAQPLNLIGGAAFAYNVLALVPFVVAYAGSLKLLRRYTTALPATAAALVFTFFNTRWFRINGHLHILWATSFLPWLLSVLLTLGQDHQSRTSNRRLLVMGGLIWGLMVNFSYYSIFLGAIPFAVWGRQLFSRRRLSQVIAIALIAAFISAPTLILYEVGNRQDHLVSWDINGLQIWGASLNSLPDESATNPIATIRQLSRAIYSGPWDETFLDEFGLVTTLLAAIGTVYLVRRRSTMTGLLWLAGLGFLLSLGLLLRWNGQEVSSQIFKPLNELIWQIGRFLKPDIFTAASPGIPFDMGIPLPGFLLTAVVPYYESARVMARYAIVGGLGLVGLAAIGLQRLPTLGRWILAGVWIVEVLPLPTTAGVPLTTLQPHPAFVWLSRQPLGAGESIVDITYPTIMIGGEVITEAQFTHKPTLSGVGSFMPSPVYYLWQYLIDDSVLHGGRAMEEPGVVKILAQYGVRYIVFHFKVKGTQTMWDQAVQNPLLKPVGCFDPNKEQSPWYYRICIAEVRSLNINILTTQGWSQSESWGTWAEGKESQAEWYATARSEYELTLDAFPYCAPHDRTTTQVVRITVNGFLLAEHDWVACQVWHAVISIPATEVRVGVANKLILNYAQATQPANHDPQSGDLRSLSVGFTHLRVQRK